MAEEHVQEKLEELHKMQVEMFQRRIAEQEDQHQRDLERERESHHEQRKAMHEHYQERTQELTKQNDGMLGAIGRLHEINQNLEKALLEAEKVARDRKEIIERNEHQLQVEMARIEVSLKEGERKMREELSRVQEENLVLRRRLGEKIPKAKKGKKA